MFLPEERDRVRDRVLELAASDARIVAAAVVGSLADGSGDRFSDLDLTFGIADGVAVADVLADWTRDLADRFDAIALLDLDTGSATYRVFLLPGWLQVDLSFAPHRVRRAAPAFRLLFGEEEVVQAASPAAEDVVGWAVLFARHALVCVEREHWWHAEFCVSGVRDHALRLACLRRGLPTVYGKGFDLLPGAVLAGFDDALVRSLDREELRRALAVAVGGLLREAAEVAPVARGIEAQLRALTADRSSSG